MQDESAIFHSFVKTFTRILHDFFLHKSVSVCSVSFMLISLYTCDSYLI